MQVITREPEPVKKATQVATFDPMDPSTFRKKTAVDVEPKEPPAKLPQPEP